MKSELTLKILPDTSNLTKALSKVKKDLQINITSSIHDEIKKLNKSITENFKFIDKKELTKINRQIKEAKIAALEVDFEKGLNDFKGKAAQIAGTAATAYGLVGTHIKNAINFEDSFADVKKVLDEATDTKKLRDGIIEMSTWIGYTSEELNKIAFAAGQMGLKGEKQILQFTELASKMGIAFDSSSEAAGQAMSNMMNIFGLSLDSVEKLGDSINNLANNTNAKAMDIVEVLGRIGGAAKDFGLSAEQTAALSDSFLALGQSPEIAGTAIKNLLGQLNGGSKKVQEWFGKMGMNYNQWFKLKENSPQEALRMFLGELGKLQGQQKTIAIRDMFGLQNLDKISTLAGALENYDKAIALNADSTAYAGSMQNEYAARADTTATKLKNLHATLTAISINLGESILPLISSAIAQVNKFLKPLMSWAQENKEIVKGIVLAGFAFVGLKILLSSLSIAWSSLLIVGYPLQKLFYVLRYNILGASIAAKAHAASVWLCNAATKAWGVTTALFSRVFVASMFSIRTALLATGIGALIAGIGFAIWAMWENWDKVAPKLIAIWEWVKNAVAPIFEWLGEKLSFLGDCFSGVFDGIKSVGGFLGGAVDSALDFLGFGNKAVVTPAQNNLNYNGLSDEVAKQMQSVQNNKNSQIYDNKTINITTLASAQEVAQAVSANSYSYAD